MGVDVPPPRPQGHTRSTSDASDSSNINLHSLPPPEPRSSRRSSNRNCLLLSLISLVVIGLVLGLSIGLTGKDNSVGADQNSLAQTKPANLKSLQNSYTLNEEIRLKFVDPNPHEDHWIGVSRAKVDPTNLKNTDIMEWMFVCGTQSCFGADESGKVKLSTGALPPGRYRAHLIKDSEPPYEVLASTKPFTVAAAVQAEEAKEIDEDEEIIEAKETGKPTKNPTLRPTEKPTKKPTVAPTASPTLKPTMATPLGSTIVSKHSTYGKNHKIHLSFSNVDAQRLDWIAIAKAGSEDGNSLKENTNLVSWIYACGSTSCARKKEAGTLTFEKGVIPPGTYQAYLVKNDGWKIKAMSEPFTISKKDFDLDDYDAISENRGSA